MDNTIRRPSAVKEANNMHSNPKVQYITQSEYYTNENDPKSTNKFDLNKDQVPYNTSFKKPINIRSVAHIKGDENEQPCPRRETQAVETLYWAETEKDRGRSIPVNSLDIKKKQPVYRTTTNFVEKPFRVDDQFYHGSAVVQSVNQVDSPRSPYSPYSSELSGNGLVFENSRPTLHPETSSMKDTRFQGRHMNTIEVPSKQTVPQRGANTNTYQPTRDGTAYGHGAYPSHISPSRDQQLYYSTSRNTNTNDVEPRPTQDSNVNTLVGITPNQSASSRVGEQQLYFHQDNSTDGNIIVVEPHRGNNTTSYVPVPLRDDFSLHGNNRNASGRPTVREPQLVDTNPLNASTRVGPNCTTFEPESDEHNQTYQSRSPTNTGPQFEYNKQHYASRSTYHRPVEPHIQENNDINRFQTLTDEYVIHENNAIYSGMPAARDQQVFYNDPVNTRLHPMRPPVPNNNNNNKSFRPTRDELFHVNNMQQKVPITYANNRRNTAASSGTRMEPEIRNRMIHSHNPNQYPNVYHNSGIRDSRNIYQNRHENASFQIDNGYQCMYNNPAIVADASFGHSAFVKSLDYVQPCYDEFGNYPPSTDRFPYEHLVYPSSAINRHEPPYAVPPTDVYYCETTTSSKKKRTRMGAVTDESDGGGDDSASASMYHNKPLVMAHTVSEGDLSDADGECSSYKTKNGRVKCSCGKTMKFSVSVKENTIKDNCVACFKKLKQDFKDLLGAYKNQGFQPCKCKNALSVTDLARAYMSGNRPECTHQDDFVQVHTCEVKGGGVLPPAQSDSIPTIGDVQLKGCKCSDKMKSYKLPSNMASCNCGGGGGGAAASGNCGCGASGGGGGGEKGGGGGGKCGSDEESSACSPCSNSAPSSPSPSTPPPSTPPPSNPPPSAPPPSKPPRSKGKPSDAPRSRAPRAGGPSGIRYEKVTMYPTSDEGSNQFLEPVEKTSSGLSHKKTATGKKHSMKRDKAPALCESDRRFNPANLPRNSSSHSSYNKGRRHTKIKGGRVSTLGLYAVPEVTTKTPFEQKSSTKILQKKKKKGKENSDEKPLKKRDKKQDRRRSNDGNARSDDSTMCERLSSRIAEFVSSADIQSKRRKEVVLETAKAPGVQKGGSARLPDHKQKRTRTRSGNSAL